MKILHYIPSIDRASGGVGTYMQLLTVELGKLVELHVVTHREANPLELENCTVHHISKNNNPFLTKGKKEFLKLLEDISPDVFHTNCCWLPMSARMAIWAKQRGYKVVYTPHGMLEPWIMKRHYWTKKLPAIQLFQRRGIEVADVIHSTADSEKENLMQLGWNANITVIPNCVQVEKIELKTSWTRTKEILFLSRVHVKKGINFLIEAVARLKDEYEAGLKEFPISRCIVAGEGDEAYVNELRDMAAQRGVGDIVDFVGGVYGETKWKLFRKADVFVLPTHSENFGIVVAEALASGTPVITTKGTPWQELKERHCGWWTEVGSEATFAALKEFLQCSEIELEKMGHNGRHLIEEKYSTKKIAADMVGLYRKIFDCV
jgi:glycosyltransferase involved in cell wall biosynthesis